MPFRIDPNVPEPHLWQSPKWVLDNVPTCTWYDDSLYHLEQYWFNLWFFEDGSELNKQVLDAIQSRVSGIITCDGVI